MFLAIISETELHQRQICFANLPTYKCTQFILTTYTTFTRNILSYK